MKVEDFDFLATLLKERSGLVLTRDKAYLLETRLMPVARQRNLKGLEELVDSLWIDRDEELENLVTEAMTTNESLFFRDTKPFDQFRDLVMPQLMQNRANIKKLRIWSAACSSGQEPYSLAMMISEAAVKLAGWRVEIVATDISTEMFAKAEAGMYTQFEVQRGLPITYLVKYFKQVGDKWQIDEKIRKMVTYKDFNLLKSPAPLGQFDVVFCRNVLIYFDQPTKAAVLQNVAQQMPQDGILYLGGAETVLGVTDKFQPIQGYRGMYMLAGGQPALVAAAE